VIHLRLNNRSVPLTAIYIHSNAEAITYSRDRQPLTGLTDYNGVRLTSQNRGQRWPIVHPTGECEWRAVVVMMPAGDNF
jgi:hypothetical protein